MKKRDSGFAASWALGASGAALTAAVATLCCAGPAVVAIIGAGGALTAAKLEPFRPYLLTGAVAMLGLGFWRAYRPSRGGATCSVRSGRVVRSALWLAAFITLASMIAPRFWS